MATISMAADMLRTMVQGGAALNWAQQRLIAISDTANFPAIDKAYTAVKAEITRGKLGPNARVD